LVNPYVETKTSSHILREFDGDVDEQELVWHRDRNDREVTVVEGTGWKLQMDNELPKELMVGKLYNIKAMEYHRLIKGNGTLKLKIWEK
jgi:hypothetical protein